VPYLRQLFEKNQSPTSLQCFAMRWLYALTPASNLATEFGISDVIIATQCKTVSDFRQSLRLDGGGAAQSRTALRANVPPFGSKIAPCRYQHSSLACENSWSFHPYSTYLPNTMPPARVSPGNIGICPPPPTPGTVKLCESSGRAGGFPFGLTVPLPSRGYWAKVGAGRTPRKLQASTPIASDSYM
jgi:hypothetical protein